MADSSNHEVVGTFNSSSSDATYDVKIDKDDRKLWCDCRGWKMKPKGKLKACTHIEKLLPQLIAQGRTSQVRGDLIYVYQNGNVPAPSPVVAAPAQAPTLPQGPVPTLAEIKKAVAAKKLSKTVLVQKTEGSGATTGFIRPMLANPLPAGKTIADYTKWVAEVKFDGHRVGILIAGDTLFAWTRYGKERTLPTHIVTALAPLPDGYYDGELVAASGKSWNLSASSNKGDEMLVIFDVLYVQTGSLLTETYQKRRAALEAAASGLAAAGPVQIAQQLTPSADTVDKIWATGGEGVILKDLTHTYKPGNRSDHWLKIKQLVDVTVTITGFEKGENGPYSVAKVVDENGINTKVKIPTNALLKQVAKNPGAWIGKQIEMSCQEKIAGTSGSYRHPRWHHAVGSDS